MSLKIDRVQLEIVIQNDESRKRLRELESEMRKLQKAVKDGTATDAQKEHLKKLQAEYDKIIDKIGLTGLSLKELQKRQQELNSILKHIPGDSPLYEQYKKQLTEVNAQIKELKNNGQQAGLSLSKMADGFNKYFGMLTAFIATVTGMSYTFRKLSENVAKMDDTYADVMKTTGMTHDEVKDLNEEFKKMDTRTAREELNNLARDAGKLGINAKKDVFDFVEAGNQINVALGEDLGEGAIKNIGKLTEVYRKSTREFDDMDLKGKMLAVGSAINELGQSSTAAEPYLVDFAQRLGGIGAQANLSIQNILGYASALDQAGEKTEMAATAFQKLIMKMMSKPDEFAKIAGMEVKKFNELIKTDMNGAIIKVLENLNKQGGLQQLIPIFKDMGLDAARAAEVVSSLANNIHLVKDAQAISNKAFSEGISLTNEYNVKNENLQAKLEKARKSFNDASLDLGEKLNPAMLKSTNYMTYVIKALPGFIDWTSKHSGIIAQSIILIGTYTVAIQIATAMQGKWTIADTLHYRTLQMKNALLATGRTIVLLYSAAVALVTGNVTRANAAWLMLSKTMKTNLFGLAAAAAVALGIALYNLWKNTKSVDEKMKEFRATTESIKEETAKYTSEISKEQNGFNTLIKAITGANEGSELRKNLIEELKSQYPQFIKYIDLEKASNQDLLAVLKDVNDQYEKKYEIAAYQGRIDAEGAGIQKAKDRQIEIKSLLKDLYSGTMSADKQNEIKKLEKEFNALEQTIQKSLTKINEYKIDVSKIETDINKSTTYKGLSDSLQETYKQIDFQKEWIEKLGDSPMMKSAVDKASKELKELEAKANMIQGKMAGMYDEMNKQNTNKENADNNNYTPTGDSDKASVQREKKNNALRELEEKHLQELAEIKRKYLSGDIASEYEYNQELLKQQDQFDSDRKDKLQELLKTVISDKSIRIEVAKEIADIDAKNLERQVQQANKIKQIILSADPLEAEKQSYDNRLREVGLFGIEKEKLTEEQKKALESLEEQHNENVRKLSSKGARKKLKELEKDQADEESKLNVRRIKEKMSEQQYKDELLKIELDYLKKKLAVNGVSAEQIEEFNKQITEKQAKNQSDKADTRQSVLDQYGIKDIKQQKEIELSILKYYEDQGILTHSEALKVKAELNRHYFEDSTKDAIASLNSIKDTAGTLSSAVSNFQQAEEMATDRKYKKLIAAAGNNKKKVAKLEEEKEKELAAIRAKHADKQFILTVAQVISSTAVAAMEAYKAMAGIPVIGPGLGAAAAAAAIMYGKSQIDVAKEQKEAAKAGYKIGGYTGGNDPDEIRGYFPDGSPYHGKEFVANADATTNPHVKKFLDVFNVAQKNGTIRMINTTQILEKAKLAGGGFKSGGYHSEPVPDSRTNRKQDESVMEEMISKNNALYEKLMERLDIPLEAFSVISGDNGSYNQTKRYERLLKNASRS